MPPPPPTLPKIPGEPVKVGMDIFLAILCTFVSAVSFAKNEIAITVIFGLLAFIDTLIIGGKFKYNEIISSGKK